MFIAYIFGKGHLFSSHQQQITEIRKPENTFASVISNDSALTGTAKYDLRTTVVVLASCPD